MTGRRLAPLLVLVGVLVVGACEDEPEEVRVPEVLQGRWVTDDGRHAGRAFEITGQRLRFDQGEQRSSVHAIHSVERGGAGSDAGGVLYEFRYRGAGEQLFRFAVRYLEDRDVLVLQNQPEIVWRRAPSGGG